MFDETLVFRAGGNLLQNALKYGEPGEPVTLVVRGEPPPQAFRSDQPDTEPWLRREVINAARGMNPDALEGLFARITRANVSGGIEGSGIGLYVVDAVARAHGGRACARMVDPDHVAFALLLPPGAPLP
jgi:two-component system OmpR family sensor kinase